MLLRHFVYAVCAHSENRSKVRSQTCAPTDTDPEHCNCNRQSIFCVLDRMKPCRVVPCKRIAASETGTATYCVLC